MTRQRTDEQRKQQIRAAATRCFVRRGYAATRLLDIAREAGLSKGGVYFHYRAKEQLFHDILGAQLAAFEARWSFEPVTDRAADVIMANLVRAHVRTIEDNPAETRLTNLLVTMAVQDVEFRDKLSKAWEVSRNLYAGVIARGIAEGVFQEANPQAMARNILSLVQGYAAQSALNEEGHLGVAVDDVVRGALRLLGAEFVAQPIVEEASCESAPEQAPAEAAQEQAAPAEAAQEQAAPAEEQAAPSEAAQEQAAPAQAAQEQRAPAEAAQEQTDPAEAAPAEVAPARPAEVAPASDAPVEVAPTQPAEVAPAAPAEVNQGAAPGSGEG